MTIADHGKLSSTAGAIELDALTAKQREVLDLLIHYKTSKEISRILEISSHTVDQRVDAAKTKLGATSRAELALIYRRLVGEVAPVYERVTYEESYLEQIAAPRHNLDQDDEIVVLPPPSQDGGRDMVSALEERDYRVVPELFDGRWGTFARLGAILGIAVLICVAFLGGLTILVQISRLLEG